MKYEMNIENPDFKRIMNEVFVFCVKDLKIEKIPKVKLMRVDGLDSDTIGGNYITHSNTIMLNIVADSLVEFADRLGHEMKHAQQWQQYPEVFDNYSTHTQDFLEYYNHPSEMDARAYGRKVVHKFSNELSLYNHSTIREID